MTNKKKKVMNIDEASDSLEKEEELKAAEEEQKKKEQQNAQPQIDTKHLHKIEQD